ncbi:MAG TPA: ABC-2 family transporter protein [Polyangiaceae bacterium]|nr:ABC-2 family transporter protein [Polyangiaceae bacterium]
MSLRSTTRALPTLLRVGFADAVAYRAEMIVWVLATTMPLVMLGLWTAVARDAPVGRYGEPQFQAYFLATFIVRQLTGSWAFWEMNFELRNGTLSMRLLRPVHPLLAYAAEGVAAMPMRVAVSIPVAVIALALVGPTGVNAKPLLWVVWAFSIVGAWLLTLMVNLLIGCAAFFFESSLKLMDLWLVFYFVLSGYLIPIDIFPTRLRSFVDWLPFRYQIGFPVELMTGSHAMPDALVLLARQAAWIAIFLGATRWAWRRGVARFSAFGG